MFDFRATQGAGEASGTLGTKVSEILNTIREGYDKRVRPNYGGIFVFCPLYVMCCDIMLATIIQVGPLSSILQQKFLHHRRRKRPIFYDTHWV